MTGTDYVRQHVQALDPTDDPKWTPIGSAHGISAFEAKAYYTIGLAREMIATAGLARASQLHLGAIFEVLAAMELIGRAVGGYRDGHGQAGARLRAGLDYALDLNSRESTPLSVLTTKEYVALRNFTGHGAAHANSPLNFDPWTGLALLHLATRALDAMWAESGTMAKFAKCLINPMTTTDQSGQTDAIYVRDVRAHLKSGKMPRDSIMFDDWRNEPVWVGLQAGSPAVTGF
ncbi:hypothetical protein [Luedemannella helvata]|uniref:Uncharacterized protein n=1 Tax=Luedemannella helvata TaxID=349315 RepID=A0ABN2KKM1_9ACTN